MTESPSASPSNARGSEEDALLDVIERMSLGQLPRIWMIVLIGLVSIIFTIIWLGIYTYLNDIIWNNNFIANNRWILPVGVLVFSILVGLVIKYLHAPTAINGGTREAITGGEGVSYRRFPGTLLSSYLSLLSGVSVGPEGPLGFLVEEITDWFNGKLKISEEATLGFKTAALASAYNGIIGSPVFTAILATELQERNRDRLWFLGWNLLAGVIGFFVFILLGLNPFLSSIVLPSLQSLDPVYIVYAIITGILGALLALFIAISFQAFGRAMARFKDRVVLRTLVAGTITAVVVYFVPEVMFSGETQIHQILNNPASYGIAVLLLFMVLKVLLLALALKSGFLGGPVFPMLFSSTMLGLALSLVFPSVPLAILVLCIEGAAIALLLGGPLTAILLVVVVGTLGAGKLEMYLIALIIVSIVVSMIIGALFKRMMTRRMARKRRVGVKESG